MRWEELDWCPKVGDRVRLFVQDDWVSAMGHKNGMIGTVQDVEYSGSQPACFIKWDDLTVDSTSTYWGRWPTSLIKILIRLVEDTKVCDWSELELM